MNKQFVVFGAGGRFGFSVACTLEEMGCEVIAVDKDQDKIQELSEVVTYAICADVNENTTFENLGLKDLDGAIVAIAENFEASIITTMKCRDLGIPTILAKAKTTVQERILLRVGATAVIFPEAAMGKRIAKSLVAPNFADWIELSPEYSLVEMRTPDNWTGRTLKELDLRGRYGLNVLGIRSGKSVSVNINPEEKLQADQILIIVGSNRSLERLQSN